MADQKKKKDDTGEDSGDDHQQMSFGDHIDDLRGCMIRAIIGVVIICIGTLWYGKDILAWMLVPGQRALRAEGLEPTLNLISVVEGFGVYMKVSIITALVLCFPWIVWQIWKFVSAGLYAHEKRIAYVIAPFSTCMVAIGVWFSYYVMVPVVLSFLIAFSVSFPMAGGQESGMMDGLNKYVADSAAVDSPEDSGKKTQDLLVKDSGLRLEAVVNDPKIDSSDNGRIFYNISQERSKVALGGKLIEFVPVVERSVGFRLGLSEYVSNILLVTIGIVIGFQLPVVMLILGWVGILDGKWLGGYRKYAFLVCMVVGAVLTPSDPISMLVLGLPLYALFELGLLLIRVVPNREAVPEEGPAEEG